MNQQNLEIGIAVNICFIATLIIYRFLIEPFISLLDPEHPIFVLTVFVLTACFTLIYIFTIILYDKFIFRFHHSLYDLGGEWFHITFIDSSEKGLRHGTFNVDRELCSFKITGKNYDIDNKYKSNFMSKMTSLRGGELLIQYQSRGSLHTRSDPIRNGMMWLTIQDGHLEGFWSDVKPSTYNGSIILFRNKEEYENRLQDEIKNIDAV